MMTTFPRLGTAERGLSGFNCCYGSDANTIWWSTTCAFRWGMSKIHSCFGYHGRQWHILWAGECMETFRKHWLVRHTEHLSGDVHQE